MYMVCILANKATFDFDFICQPSLTYVLECINTPDKYPQSLNIVQGKRIKQSLGLSKHPHNTQMLEAMSIKSVTDIVSRNTVYITESSRWQPDKDYEFLFDVFISFKWDCCAGLFTGENCEVWVFSNGTLLIIQPNRKGFSGRYVHADSL